MITRESNIEEVEAWVKSVEIPDALFYKVGDWMWCEFPSKPDETTRKVLKEAGFFFNSKRVVWQHSCGNKARRNAKYDPRTVYEVESV